jgi:hypothetical protein
MALMLLSMAIVCFIIFAILVGIWIVLTIIRLLLFIWICLLTFLIYLTQKIQAPVTVPEVPTHENKLPVIDLKDDEWHYVS